MNIDGLKLLPGFYDTAAQTALVNQLRGKVRACPFFTPTMPKSGRPMSVRMTNLGSLGWVTDRSGYRYQATHPDTGLPWASIPDKLLTLWQQVADYSHPPEACLVNHYTDNARMGLHQDADEQDLSAPVVSVSLGETAIFRIGGTSRKDSTRSFKLYSGDVLVMGGASRMRFHGVDRIVPGTSTLLSGGGRLNLTLRRVTRIR